LLITIFVFGSLSKIKADIVLHYSEREFRVNLGGGLKRGD